MEHYHTDGKRLVNVEYDVQPNVSDTIDGLRVLSKHQKSSDEYALFVLESNGDVGVFVFDEIYVIGRVSGYETLSEAVSAWMNEEI